MIKAAFFDMDGTLVSYKGHRYNSSWEAIGEALGVSKEWDEMNQYYISRKHLYAEWYERQTSMMKNVDVAKIHRRIFPIPYSTGVVETAPYISSKYKTGIITSGVNIVAERVRQELGFDFCKCNALEVKGGKLTGKTLSYVRLWEKAENFLKMCEQAKVRPGETCFVGDHLNDIPVFKLSGMAIAFNPKEKEVEEAAQCTIRDFKELKEFL